MTMNTYSDTITQLEVVVQSANHIAAHAKAVSRSMSRIDPMIAAMFNNVADDADDLVDRTNAIIEATKAQRAMKLNEVFNTLIMDDTDQPTFEDVWEVDEWRTGEILRFRTEVPS
jgi:hypothetical protein